MLRVKSVFLDVIVISTLQWPTPLGGAAPGGEDDVSGVAARGAAAAAPRAHRK